MTRRFFLITVPALLLSCRSVPQVPENADAVPEKTAFTMLPEDFPVIRVERGGFSPNGDGLFDTISLFPQVGRQDALTSWSVDIEDSEGNIVRRFSGKPPIENAIVWDGLDERSKPSREGIYRGRFTAEFGTEGTFMAETALFALVLEGPDVTLAIDDGAFSPDGDGIDDTYVVGMAVAVPEETADWEIMIRDPAGTPFRLEKRIGPPPSQWIWNGRGADDSTALSGADYPITLVVTDIWGNKTVMDWQVHVDVLVIPEGDRYRISLSRIFFQPYTANYMDVPEQERLSNEKTIDQVVSILEKYENYQVSLVGHAVHVNWFRQDLMNREQDEILMPLSLARAEAIRDALIDRGIQASRLSVEGRGGSEPVVPHSDLRNRWRNRRVVFYLTP